MKNKDNFKVYVIDGVIYIHFPKREVKKWNPLKYILKI